MVGNAVPVKLAEALAKKIRSDFEMLTNSINRQESENERIIEMV
jgi:hypothetical protein